MHFFKRNKFLTVLLIVLTIYVYQNFTRIVVTNKVVDKTSIHYVNDLYMSDGRIYNNYLNNKEKKIYMKLLKQAKNYDTTFKMNLSEYNCIDYETCGNLLFKTHDALTLDHPELMSYAGIKYSFNSQKGNYLAVTLSFSINDNIKQSFAVLKTQRIIADIKDATKNMDDLDKIKYVYNWIGENETYDKMFTYFSKNQSIYNVFMKNNAVCAGFAKASQVIFQNIGIESWTIDGNSTGPHMWNVIKYKDKYYYYDSTVAASLKKKKYQGYYDGLKQSELNFYTTKYPDWYPEIEKENMPGIDKKV